MPTVILSISLLLRVSLSIPAKVQVARIRKTVILLTATATILRLELALFLLPIVLSLVIQRKVSFMSALAYGVIGGLGSLGESCSIGALRCVNIPNSDCPQRFPLPSTIPYGYPRYPIPTSRSTVRGSFYGRKPLLCITIYSKATLRNGVYPLGTTTWSTQSPRSRWLASHLPCLVSLSGSAARSLVTRSYRSSDWPNSTEARKGRVLPKFFVYLVQEL